MRLLTTLAALNGLVGVALAAVAAHAIHDPLAAGHATSAATLQMIHALAALAALLAVPGRTGVWIAAAFVAGATLFTLGVGIHAFGGPSLGPVAPIGGTLMMLGWAGIALAGARGFASGGGRA